MTVRTDESKNEQLFESMQRRLSKSDYTFNDFKIDKEEINISTTNEFIWLVRKSGTVLVKKELLFQAKEILEYYIRNDNSLKIYHIKKKESKIMKIGTEKLLTLI